MRGGHNKSSKILSECKDKYLETPFIFPKVERIIVFGDIHGDMNMATNLLLMSGVATHVANKLMWTGKETHVVQIGDQLDRCRPFVNGAYSKCDTKHTAYNDEASDIKILDLFNDLHEQAVKVGGAVISLLGNHEMLNSNGILDYVSYEGIQEFKGYIDPKNGALFTDGKKGRAHAFAPGNEYGKLLGCSRMPSVIIGSNIFVHAGIIDTFMETHNIKKRDDLDALNMSIKMWLIGVLKNEDSYYINDIIEGSRDSLFWTRALGMLEPGLSFDACEKTIGNTLDVLKIGHMIIGHTPQFINEAGINSTCDNKVWRVDTGSSMAFNNLGRRVMNNKYRNYQYLEIRDDEKFYICDNYGCNKQEK